MPLLQRSDLTWDNRDDAALASAPVDDPERAFGALVEVLRGRTHEQTLEGRLDDFLVLSRVGEGGVAIEHLCSNLCESSVPLAMDEHARLVDLATLWGVASSTADELKRLTPRGG